MVLLTGPLDEFRAAPARCAVGTHCYNLEDERIARIQWKVMPVSSGSSSARRIHKLMPSVRWPLHAGVTLAIAALAALGTGAAWRGLTRPDPDRIWHEAEANLKAGRLAEAQARLRQLESLRPATPQDWILCAQILSAQGRADEALVRLKRVPDNHALAAQAWLMAARLERQQHRVRNAETALRRAIALKPWLVDAHRELVYILGMQLRRREVDAEFKALARLTPLTHHDLFTWGLTHFTVWGPDIADDLESFIKADPLDRYSRLALATLVVDEPAMESRVESALEPLPVSDPEATALRIELRLNHGQIDQAVAMLEEAPAGNPQLARLRGRVALMRGDHAAAIRCFQEALSEEPYDRVSLSELGKALLLKGDKSAAEVYLTRVRRLDDVYNLINRVRRPSQENQAPDLTQLGRACEAAGLLDEARGWYLLAIGRDPLDSEAQQALRRLLEARLWGGPRPPQNQWKMPTALANLVVSLAPPPLQSSRSIRAR
jgi:tetratricopeptide (TPR) repeat protein